MSKDFNVTEEWGEAGTVYSNFDHTLDDDVAKEIKGKEFYSQHAAHDFCGYIYWRDDQWHEQVWIYKRPVATLSDADLKYLISEVNAEYGDA